MRARWTETAPVRRHACQSLVQADQPARQKGQDAVKFCGRRCALVHRSRHQRFDRLIAEIPSPEAGPEYKISAGRADGPYEVGKFREAAASSDFAPPHSHKLLGNGQPQSWRSSSLGIATHPKSQTPGAIAAAFLGNLGSNSRCRSV